MTSDETVQQENIPASLFASGNHAEDIAQVHNQGFQINDDNDPSPDNIPDPSEAVDLRLKKCSS